MTERKMFTIDLIRLNFRMIFFTFIHTLCGSCIISEDYPKRNCISCLREVVFLKFIVIILWDDFRLSFLTLDYSRVVYPSWDSSTIPDNILCSYQALRRLKERCWPPRLPLTLDFSCVTFTFICMPLWVLDNLRLFLFNEIVFPVFMIKVIFPEFIDNIVCGESFSHT
jgi:hypothetical protein